MSTITNTTEAKEVSKWRIYAIFFGLFAAITFATWAVSGIIAYPTDQHREISVEHGQLLAAAWEKDDIVAALEDPKITQLEATPEYRYSIIASGVLLAVQFVIAVVAIGYIYTYLRSNRIGSSYVRPTVLIATFAGSLPILLMTPTAEFFGYPSGETLIPAGNSLASVLVSLVISIVMGLIVSFIITRIFEWRYNRKYNFSVE